MSCHVVGASSFLVVALFYVVTASDAQKTPNAQLPLRVVIDTDIGQDMDDQWSIAYMVTHSPYPIR